MFGLLGVSSGLQLLDSVLFFLVNVLIYRAVSRRALPWWQVILGGLVSALLTTYSPDGLRFLVNPLILTLLSYQTDPVLSKRHHVFYGFYTWGVSDLILRMVCLFIVPLLIGTESYVVENQALYHLLCVLSVYPIYHFIHRYMGVEYLKVQERWLAEGRLVRLLSWWTAGLVAYGFMLDVLDALAFLITEPSRYNYLKLLVLLAICFFFIMISYANRWVLDRSFNQLQEEQDRHFQSLRDSNQHILRLYQDLSRQGAPKPNWELREKARPRGHKGNDCLVLTEEELPFTRHLPEIANVYSHLLRSVIESRYMEARRAGIAFVLEVPEQVRFESVDVVDMSLILQDFLAKAFQVARALPKGLLRVYMGHATEGQVLVVETLSQDNQGDVSLGDLDDQVFQAPANRVPLDAILERYPQAKVVSDKTPRLFSQMFEC